MKLFKKAKESLDKYWNLPPMERLHYDSCRREIERSTFPVLMYTKFLLVALTLFLGILALVSISHNIFNEFLSALAPLAIDIAKMLVITISVDSLAVIILNPTIRIIQIKKLNKRFNLK